MFKSMASAVLALLATADFLKAEPAVVVTLPSVSDRVRSQNPDLAAARFRITEALGRMNQSGRLDNPGLETSLEHNPRFREGKLEIGFSQRFPLTQRLRLEKTVGAIELKAAEAEVRDVERRLIAEARTAIVNVLSIRQRRQLLKEQAELSKNFARFLSEAAEKGEASSLDAGMSKLEAISLVTELSQLDAEEAGMEGVLKPLLGMLPGSSISISGTLAEPSIPRLNLDPSARPDLQAAQWEAKAAGQGVILEQARRYDDVEAGVFAAGERTEDAPEGYENEALVGFRLKVALPFWNKNEGAIQEAEARKSRKEKEATALSRTIRLDAEAARKEMEQWAKLAIELRSTLQPLADEQAKLSEEAFRNGQGEIQTVFRSREKSLQLSGARIDALRQFHLARVRYETALATY